MGRALLLLAAVGVIVGLCSVDRAAAHADSPRLQHVTLIGDSVATAISLDTYAKQIVGQGVDLDLEVSACRRLEDQSCPPNPPTAIQLIKSLGTSIGPNVVIAVGYNDYEDRYAGAIADTLQALAAVGVKRVFWLTLRAQHHGYLTMNDDIVAAAQTHPGMTVIDWNRYSRSHPDWFQPDGIHLVAGGEIAMAKLVHLRLVEAGVALAPVQVGSARLPQARRGKPYRARLAARSGEAPYRWSLVTRLPAGLRLGSSGTIAGTPKRFDLPATFVFVVRVRDAAGQTATRTLRLRLR
jgi:hypothetical protein